MQLTTSATSNRCKSVGGFADGRMAGVRMGARPLQNWAMEARATTSSRKVENAPLLFGRVGRGARKVLSKIALPTAHLSIALEPLHISFSPATHIFFPSHPASRILSTFDQRPAKTTNAKNVFTLQKVDEKLDGRYPPPVHEKQPRCRSQQPRAGRREHAAAPCRDPSRNPPLTACLEPPLLSIVACTIFQRSRWCRRQWRCFVSFAKHEQQPEYRRRPCS